MNPAIVYVANADSQDISVLARDRRDGSIQWRQTFVVGGNVMPMALSPDGRFLSTSERSSSSLARWAADADTGALTLLGHTRTEAQPRGFAIDLSGRWLPAVGQLSPHLTVCAISPQDGALRDVTRLSVGRNPNWVCIAAPP